MNGIVTNRHDVFLRDQKIMSMYLLGMSRKQIVRESESLLGQRLQYDAVKKILQKILRQLSLRK